MADAMFDPLERRPEGSGSEVSPIEGSIRQSPGCKLEQYSTSKQLPLDYLIGLGITEVNYMGSPAVRIPYRDSNGNEKAVRYRTAPSKGAATDNRFRWKTGSKSFLYGLWRLDRSQDSVVLVEGESDCHSLWLHGINAVGLPGAGNWSESRDADHLVGFKTIYVVLEQDEGGEAVQNWLTKSRIREQARLVRITEFGDPSEMHVANTSMFVERWTQLERSSVSWLTHDAELSNSARNEAWSGLF